MRIFEFMGSAKTIALTTVQTLTWTGSDLPGSRVVAFFLSLAPGGNILTDIDRIRVKARGSTIIDATTSQIRGLLEQTVGVGTVWAGTLQTLTIPFFDLMEPREEEQDLQQFPMGEQPTVEVVTNAGTAAGTAIMGWAQTDQDPVWYPRVLSTAHAIPLSANNGRMNFSEPEDFRGLAIPTTALKRLKIYQNGQSIFNLPGVAYATAQGDLVTEQARLRGSFSTGAVTDPMWILPRSNRPANPGQSWVEADTDAGWAAAGEIAIYGRSRQLV